MGKRVSIRKKVQRMVLFLCVAALVITGILWMGSIGVIRSTVLRGTEDLGQIASGAGEEALLRRMEQNLENTVQSEADVLNNKLLLFSDTVRDCAFAAQRMYQEPDAYVPVAVNPPDAKNKYYYTLQLTLANESVDPAAIAEEVSLLANLVHMWQPVITNNSDIIAAIYLGTESGAMINYDKRSDLTTAYYDYFQSSWYQAARDAGKPIFTSPYEDSFGRGTMISCAAPFYDENGDFAGVISMDIMIDDLRRFVMGINFSSSSYAFLVDTAGDIFVSRRPAAKGTFENVRDPGCDAYEAAEQILSGETGVTLTSKEIYYGYARIPASNWILAIHTPRSDIVLPAKQIGRTITSMTDDTAASLQANIYKAVALSLVAFVLIIAVTIVVSDRSVRQLTQPLLALQEDVGKIGKDLNHRATVSQNDEIGDLAHAFNDMAVSLEEHIKELTTVTAEKQRISTELNVATHIQSSMLPCIFPAFPDRTEFDIYATMDPAKEVGGDFYDFFMVDERHLAVVVADVSGKGVPAALFMVIGKTLIKDHTFTNQTGDLGMVFAEVNNILCQSNSEMMFITAFEAVLDLVTGEFLYVNAGHEKPYLCKKDGTYQPFDPHTGFVLAAMEDMQYRAEHMVLEPGDKIYLYTDGVPEATDANNELYGMDRLTAVLGKGRDLTPEELLPTVKADIDLFVGDAPQFDDITMLCLEYKERMTEQVGGGV